MPKTMAMMIGLEKPEEVKETVKVETKDYIGPEIPLPSGYTPPDDAQPGEDISVLMKLRMKPNGNACITSVDGAPYEKEEVKETTEESVEKPPVEGGLKTGVMDGGSLSERIGNVRKKIQSTGY